ncbi:hypothetical protein MMC29_000799 [Sticta canariensis]|nr:hypothetical protein [Sticta canariensis]
MPSLSVAMYQSEHGVYEHWALHLQNNTTDTIYEVVGELPNFQTHVLLKSPSATKRHKRSVFLCNINETDMALFENVLATLAPANSPEGWNCQNYVLDVIDELEEKGVIENSNEAYIEAKKQLSEHFGPLS